MAVKKKKKAVKKTEAAESMQTGKALAVPVPPPPEASMEPKKGRQPPEPDVKSSLLEKIQKKFSGSSPKKVVIDDIFEDKAEKDDFMERLSSLRESLQETGRDKLLQEEIESVGSNLAGRISRIEKKLFDKNGVVSETENYMRKGVDEAVAKFEKALSKQGAEIPARVDTIEKKVNTDEEVLSRLIDKVNEVAEFRRNVDTEMEKLDEFGKVVSDVSNRLQFLEGALRDEFEAREKLVVDVMQRFERIDRLQSQLDDLKDIVQESIGASAKDEILSVSGELENKINELRRDLEVKVAAVSGRMNRKKKASGKKETESKKQMDEEKKELMLDDVDRDIERLASCSSSEECAKIDEIMGRINNIKSRLD